MQRDLRIPDMGTDLVANDKSAGIGHIFNLRSSYMLSVVLYRCDHGYSYMLNVVWCTCEHGCCVGYNSSAGS